MLNILLQVLARGLTLSCGLQPLHEAIKFAICLWGEPSKQVRQNLACQVLSFQDVLDAGASSASSFQMADIKPSDLATFVYTSGTTGNPKVCPHCPKSAICCKEFHRAFHVHMEARVLTLAAFDVCSHVHAFSSCPAVPSA